MKIPTCKHGILAAFLTFLVTTAANAAPPTDEQHECRSFGGRDGVEILSFLTPDQIAAIGKIPELAIIGCLEVVDGEKRFRPNPAFVEYMHQVIKRTGPSIESMQAVALRQGTGYVYVIDLRTPDGPQGRVPMEDIIGAFEIKEGRILADSYWRNDKHMLYTKDGCVSLPGPLHAALVAGVIGDHSADRH